MPILTVAGIDKYRPGSTYREFSDHGAPGTGLALAIQARKPNDPKRITLSWIQRFRRPDGRTAKLTLGRYTKIELAGNPVLGSPLTLLQARQLANEITRQRQQGTDVIEQYKVRERQRAAAALERSANTFQAATVKFFAEHKTKHHERPRRWRDDAKLLGLSYAKDANPAKVAPDVIKGSLADKWGSRPIAEITAHDIFVICDEAKKLGIPGIPRRNEEASENRARKMFGALSVLFQWAVRQRLIASSPCAGLARPRAPKSREQILTDDQIKAFWLACDAVPAPYAVATKVMLLTGCRLNEVAGMRREELAGDIWTIPASRSKNHRKHQVALSPLVMDLIAGLPRIEGPFVFTYSGRTAIIGGWSKMKAKLDQIMGHTDWRLHDLRRTFASGLSRLGVRAEVIERCLNHRSGVFGGIAGVYQVDPLTHETREAWARWSAHITGLMTGKPDKIVALRGKK